jgi:hypothetical protein
VATEACECVGVTTEACSDGAGARASGCGRSCEWGRMRALMVRVFLQWQRRCASGDGGMR